MYVRTAAELLAACDLEQHGRVTWGTRLPEPDPGAYIVTLPTWTSEAPLDLEAIDRWLTRRPELTIAGARPTPEVLADYLARWWLPTEVIVYIGKAANLRQRVGQYYDTELGARSPHAGGAWLKTLTGLSELAVSWSTTATHTEAEASLLAAFAANVTPPATYPDRNFVLPWANLEARPNGTLRRRQHQLLGTRAARRQGPGDRGRVDVRQRPED